MNQNIRLRSSIWLITLLLLTQNTIAQIDLKGKLPIDPNVRIGKLANGLTYYIRKNTKPEKKVQLRLVVNTGSVLETPDQQGLAHMMEHMNFNGTKHFQKNELVNYLQSIGVQFGADLNAYTSFDETVYILPIPSDDPVKIDKGFTILEDWAGNALLDTAEINKERGVVLEESRLGKGAGERMGKKYFPELFNGSPYASRLPIGKDSIIQNFKAESLVNFYKTWYRPDLEAVIVVGDIDPQVALDEITKHFSAFKNPATETPRPAIIPFGERKNDVGMVLTDKEQTLKILEVFNYVEKDKQILTWSDYRESIVERLFNSLLGQRLNELTQQANPPFLFGSTSFGNFIRGYRSFISVAAIGNQPVKDAIDAMISTTESVRKYGFVPTELERGKLSLLNETETEYNDRDKTESGQLVQGYVNNFLTNAPIVGSANRYAFIKQILSSISLEELNALGKRIESKQGKFALLLSPDKKDTPLPSDNELISMVASAHEMPVKPYEEKATASSLMVKKPTPGKITSEKKNALLKTTDLMLSNGITVTLRPTDFKNDDIQMDAWRKGGAHNFGLADKENAQNVAFLIQQMGLKNMKPTDLRKYLSGKTVRVQPYINTYEEGIEGSSSIKDFETMLQLVHLYFTSPGSDPDLFHAYINSQKGFVQNMKDNPASFFADTIAKVQFNNNPWNDGIPKASDYDKIDLGKVNSIYKSVYGNAYGMHFTFVGNIDPVKIKALLETYIGSLPAKQKINKFTDEGLRPVKGNVDLTIYKGAAKQSRVNIIFNGEAPYSQEENLKVQMITQVLNIKIIEKLREDMSLIYGGGLNGALIQRPYNHYTISAGFPCAPENVDKVITAFFEIIKNVQANGVDQKDLDKVKETLKKQNEDVLKDNEHWLTVLGNSWIEGTDAMWMYDYAKKVNAMSAGDMKQAAIKYFNMKNYIKAILNPEK